MIEHLEIPQIRRRDFFSLLAAPFLASTLAECQVSFAQTLRVTVEKDGSATIDGEISSVFMTVHLPFGIANPEKGDFRIEIPEATWGRCTPIDIFIPPTISDLGFSFEIGPDRNTLRMVLSTRKDNIPRDMGEREVGLAQGRDEEVQIFEGGWEKWVINRISQNGTLLSPDRWTDETLRGVLHFDKCGKRSLTV